MNRELIERFAAGAAQLAAEIRGLSPAQLDAHPIPGTWSIREIVVHMRDSDAVGVERMKRVIAMPNPLLMGYDENAFAVSLDYASADLNVCCQLFQLNRDHLSAILRKLPDEAFRRTGIHSETGLKTLEILVKAYVDHLEGHLVHVRKKRAMLTDGVV